MSPSDGTTTGVAATPPGGWFPAVGTTRNRPLWALIALLAAGTWSVVQLALGLTWLAAPQALRGGRFDNPFDPAVDLGGGSTSLLSQLDAARSALVLTALAGAGLLLTVLMAAVRPTPDGRRSWWRTGITALACLEGAVGALLIPDYRLIATIAYTPVVAIQQLIGADTRVTVADLYTRTTVAMIVAMLAGVAFGAAAVAFDRRMRAACLWCGRTGRSGRWTSPSAARRWGTWLTVIAIVIPVGYAVTRWAWALGIPLGVSSELLVELGAFVWMGAALGSMAIGGAILTVGLIRPWGEVFPRWIPGLRGRRVPISLAVAPALVVAVLVASAGLMFGRMALTGRLENDFPGTVGDVAAWLPEMFWPIWGLALAGAAVAYWLRRRGTCDRCGQGDLEEGLAVL